MKAVFFLQCREIFTFPPYFFKRLLRHESEQLCYQLVNRRFTFDSECLDIIAENGWGSLIYIALTQGVITSEQARSHIETLFGFVGTLPDESDDDSVIFSLYHFGLLDEKATEYLLDRVDLLKYIGELNIPLSPKCLPALLKANKSSLISRWFHSRKFDIPAVFPILLSASPFDQKALAMVQFMLQRGCHFEVDSSHAVAVSGNVQLMKLLASHGAPFDEKTISLAAENGHEDLVDFLRSEDCEGNFDALTSEEENK